MPSDDERAVTGRLQRIAAYSVCVDAEQRILLCRLTAITDRPGSWTLPGGGVEFGEHPEAAALRELEEEAGLTGSIVRLLAVDSIARVFDGAGAGREYHGVRIVYRTEVTGGVLRFEAEGSTDQAAWFTHAEADELPLVEMGRLGVQLAFGDTP